MPDVKVPLLGNVPRGALIMGGGAAVVVTGYLIYHNKKQSVVSTAYGYGAGGYGYGASAGSSFYGYGFNYGAYSGAGGGGVTPYPVGSEYGYGAYGYGYYNPYTGQYIGPVQQQPPPVNPGGPNKPGLKGKWVTINGKRYYFGPKQNILERWTKHGKQTIKL